MLPGWFALVGAVVGSLGGLWYLAETVTGRSQPNRVTWLLWGVFPLIVFVAQRSQQVDLQSWISFAAGATPLLVVLGSFLNRRAYWRTSRRDIVVLSAALVGMLLWAVTREPNLAILFSIVADLLAALPTVAKAYRFPASESWISYSISTVGFGIGLLAVQRLDFETAAFTGYLLVLNALLAGLSVRARLG